MFPILQSQPPFSVLDLPGLFAWYKASDVYGNNTNPASGTHLAIWNDKSTSGFDFTQAVGANQPEFITNQQNGHPGVYFIVPNDMVGPAAFLSHVSSGIYTIYMVMRAFSGDNIPLMAVADDLNNRFNFIVPLSANSSVYIDYGDVIGGNRLIVAEADIFSGTYAHCFQVDTPAINNFRNNTLLGTNNNAGTFTPGVKVPH